MRASTHRNVRRLAASSIALLALGLQANTVVGTAVAAPNTSTAAIAPATVANSSTASYAFTLTNTSGLTGTVLPLGSAQVTLPAGWGQPTFTSLPSGWTVAQNGGGTWCVSSAAGLPSGQSATFNYTELAQSTAGTATFATAAFIGQNCSLTLGAFPYDGSQPTVNVDTLSYTQQTLAGVTTKALTPGFTVVAKNAGGNVDTSFTEPVKLSIGTNPGGETSFTSATATPTNGAATFANVTLNKVSSSGYTLNASSDGSPGVATQSIFIQPAGTAVVCPPNQTCDTGLVHTPGASPTSAEAVGASGPSTDVVDLAIGVPNISCAGMSVPTNPAPLGVFVADFNRHMTVTVYYDRDQDNDPPSQYTTPLSPANYQPVCFQGSPGTGDPSTPTILHACTSTSGGFGAPSPCIQAEYVNPHGNEYKIVLSLNPDPDPKITMP
jgi:hypothetical protein